MTSTLGQLPSMQREHAQGAQAKTSKAGENEQGQAAPTLSLGAKALS